jgi:hypothetical protein
MQEEIRWKIVAGIALVTLTLFLMITHFLIFQDSHYLLITFLADLAFVPVEVLCVSLILDRMLSSRERQQRLEKLNMVIGIFFSRAGIPLLARFAKADPSGGRFSALVTTGPDWDAEKFRSAYATLGGWKGKIDPTGIDLCALQEFLMKNEDFLIRIVENPMVFEHESFTDMMLALTHLNEDLKARGDLSLLSPADMAHLATDIERVYSHLVPEWLKYMEYLGNHYPYLFSFVMRHNPFNVNTGVTVGG